MNIFFITETLIFFTVSRTDLPAPSKIQSRVSEENNGDSQSLSSIGKDASVRDLTGDEKSNPFTSQCLICYKHFSSVFEHETHHQEMHKGMPYTCTVCGQQFPCENVASWRNHELDHKTLQEFTCEHCDKKFADIDDFELHLKTHSGAKHFACRFCGKLFLHKFLSSIHERMHTKHKPYSCRFCDKQFSYVQHRKTHERIHTGETPYSCKFCDKKFSCDSNRRRHENIHTGGEKPSEKKCYREASYSCRFCGKLFISKKSLRQHEESHANFNRYSCELCGKTFSRKRYCTDHIRLHTQSYSCRVCKKSFTCNYTSKKLDICNVCRKRNVFFECVQKIKTQSASSLICMKTKSVSDHRESDQDKISKFSNLINKMEAKCDDTNKYEEEDKTSNFGDDDQIENQHQSEYFSC